MRADRDLIQKIRRGTRTAVLLSSYNRPRLILDAIESLLDQTTYEVTAIILDDGSTPWAFEQILRFVERKFGVSTRSVPTPGGPTTVHGFEQQTMCMLWRGDQRSIQQRKATIPFARAINLALNHLVRPEFAPEVEFISYLCDDDYFYPESIGDRVDYLLQHPEHHVAVGRLRAIQFDQQGMNLWQKNARPCFGRHFPRPTGDKRGNRTYFAEDGSDGYTHDPDTNLPFVEEGSWKEGEHRYGSDVGCMAPDHNQVLHRRDLLWKMLPNDLPMADLGGKQFWPEDPRLDEEALEHSLPLGDKLFFRRLSSCTPLVGVNTWAATKRYHSLNGGPDVRIRE